METKNTKTTNKTKTATFDDNKKDDRKGSKKGSFFKRKRAEKSRPKLEYDTKILSARRVARVVAGGRRFSLSVAVAIGNRKGSVGVGTGKGPDMAIAMNKARNQAHKNLINVPLTENKGILNEVKGKYCASVVSLKPSKGFVAGGAVRLLSELAGIENINAKILSRSKSHLNNARATLKAFNSFKK